MMVVFFAYFALMSMAAAVLTVALRNPVHCGLALLALLLHVSGLFVLLNAEFLWAVQVVVYAGAILVLYLFVVMLLNLKQDERYHRQWPVAAGVGILLILEAVVLTLLKGRSSAAGSVAEGTAEKGLGNTEALGDVLYSTYLFPFEVASLILLVAMIGAIILAKKDLGGESMQ